MIKNKILNPNDDEENEDIKDVNSSPPSTPVGRYGSLTTFDERDSRAVPLLPLPITRSSSRSSYHSTEKKQTKRNGKKEQKYSDRDTEASLSSTSPKAIDMKHVATPSQKITHDRVDDTEGLEEIKVIDEPHVPLLVPTISNHRDIEEALIRSWLNNQGLNNEEQLPKLIADQLSSLSAREASIVEYAAFNLLLTRSDQDRALIRQSVAEEKRKKANRWCLTRWFCSSDSMLYQKGLLFTGLMFMAGVGIAGGFLWQWTHNFDPTAFPTTLTFNELNQNVATTLKDLDHLINMVWPTRTFMVVGGSLGVLGLLLYHIIKACLIRPREIMEYNLQRDLKTVQSKLKASMDVIQRQHSLINLNEAKLNQVSEEQTDQLTECFQSLTHNLQVLQEQIDRLQPSESKSYDAPETPPPTPRSNSPIPTAGYGARNMSLAMNRVSLIKGTLGSRVSSNSSAVFSSSSSSSSSSTSSSRLSSNFSSNSSFSFNNNNSR